LDIHRTYDFLILCNKTFGCLYQHSLFPLGDICFDTQRSILLSKQMLIEAEKYFLEKRKIIERKSLLQIKEYITTVNSKKNFFVHSPAKTNRSIMKNVLILGAGLVSKPAIFYLLDKKINVTIAAMDISPIKDITQKYPNAQVVKWTTDEKERLDEMVSNNDVIVSLLPFVFHPMVAEYCIKHRRHLVTTSYVKPEMQALDQAARNAGVILLNEIGLDPGIDHMSAMRIIDHIHQRGGKVEEFYSICGALPAPESVNNPLGYKFSWAPRGVILASKSDALYLKNGEKRFIPTKDLFADSFTVDFENVGKLEVYPNRNSIDYIDIYKIPEVKTMYRGTFRFPGWCETLHVMKQLDLLDETQTNLKGLSPAAIVAQKNKVEADNLKKNLAAKIAVAESSTALSALEWLGLFDTEPLTYEPNSLFNLVADKMLEKMSMNSTDRDMIVMLHSFVASYPDGKKEVIRSKMLDFGDIASHTAIARTVSLPAAIAVEMILNGNIKLTGVWRPVVPEIYNPVLDQLETMGIKMEEEYGLPLSQKIN